MQLCVHCKDHLVLYRSQERPGRKEYEHLTIFERIVTMPPLENLVYAHVQEYVHSNAMNAFVITQSYMIWLQPVVSLDSGYHLLLFNTTLGVFGGCCGVSGTITSSNFSCPTAAIVNETALLAIDSC
jgi:hypothetical protein